MQLTVNSPTSVTVSWTNNEPNPYSLYIDRATDTLFTQNVVSEVLTMGTTSFTDTSVVSGTVYYWRIRTVNASGTSLSSIVTTSTQAGTPFLTLQSFLGSLPVDDTVIWQGLQWRPGNLATLLVFTNDSRLSLRLAISGTSTTLLNADGSTNSSPLTLIKRWPGQIE